MVSPAIQAQADGVGLVVSRVILARQALVGGQVYLDSLDGQVFLDLAVIVV